MRKCIESIRRIDDLRINGKYEYKLLIDDPDYFKYPLEAHNALKSVSAELISVDNVVTTYLIRGVLTSQWIDISLEYLSQLGWEF